MGCRNFGRGAMDLITCVVLFVLLHHVGQISSQECLEAADTEKLTFNAGGTTSNISAQVRDRRALAPLYRMVRLFLKAVQPNPFPEELLRVVLNNPSSLRHSQVAKYEAGYVTCAVIAVLFLILMMLSAIIFGLFQCRRIKTSRCCKGVRCQRTPVLLCLLVTCSILFAGLVCTFDLNQRVNKEVGPGVQDITNTLHNFRNSISSIPLVLGEALSEFSIPKNKVLAELQRFGPAIGHSVYSKLNEEIYPHLENALKTAKELETAALNVVKVNMTVSSLQHRQDGLETALTGHKLKLQTILSDQRCANCTEAADTLQELRLGINYKQIPSFQDFVKKVNNVRKVNLTGIFQQGIKAFNEIPKLVTTQSSRSINDIRNALNSAEQQIQSYAGTISIERYTDPINKALLNIENKTVLYGKEVERYEQYRWIIGIVLCCVILLIIVCTLLGLLLGVWGLYVQQEPSDSRLKRKVGSGFLMVGVYLSFFFSWMLILLVFTTFLVGGNVQTLLCRHWANQDIYKFLDDPTNLPQDMDLKRQLGLKENTSFTDMYQQCKKGAPFWDVLQFNNPIDLDNSFNITRYTAEFQLKINNFTVDVGGLAFLTGIAIKVLMDYKNSQIDQVPYGNITTQIQTPVLTPDIGQFISALETLGLSQNNTEIRSQLEDEVSALRDLQGTTLQEQKADVRKLNDTLYDLALISPILQADINRTIEDVRVLQGPKIQEALGLLKNESSCFLKQAMSYFSQYLEWLKRKITEDISSCRSVSLTLDNSRVIICDHVTEPWNGFWFCLGWCTFFLIPNIIFSIKAVQHLTPFTPRSRLSLSL
ncbi:prominin-2 isoform X2 [Ascaphus truei]|uniref:prominin-2 isoform X2 n=1 Tax=Ascaphus truei TaxID=8439 RepID=UPI003F5A15CD